MDDQTPADIYLTATQIRARYNVSDMSIWRWLRDPHLKFPQPIIINRRRYWRLSELVSWEHALAAQRRVA